MYVWSQCLKKVLDILELELWMAGNYRVDLETKLGYSARTSALNHRAISPAPLTPFFCFFVFQDRVSLFLAPTALELAL